MICSGDLRHDANSFTVLRWLLASTVMFSHAFELTAHHAGSGSDPSRVVLPFPVSRLAVLLFFSLSGFLVTGSLAKRGVVDFVIARALRLVPGLWMMLAVTILVFGIGFNAGSFTGLIHSPSLHRYLGHNLLLLGHAYSLDGVVAGNPLPTVVNGSLWTIPQEVRCYAALAVVGGVGLLASRRVLGLVFVAGLIATLVIPADAVAWLAEPRPLAVSFFFGVLLYLWREHVVLSWPLAGVVVVAALALPHGPLAEAATGLAFAYAALVAAFLCTPRVKAFSAAMPDYSYGIYIYGFPAQQAAIALSLGVTPYANLATGFALTLPLAALSWHLVEKPALALKPRLTRAAVARSKRLSA